MTTTLSDRATRAALPSTSGGAGVRPVVVGVDLDSPESLAALRWAAHEASIRGCPLRVVHVSPDAMSREASGRIRHLLASVRAITRRLDQWLSPDLVATDPDRSQVVLLRGVPADQLIAQSRSAELLVLGVDHTRSRADHGTTGPLEDRVAVHAHCPLALVPLAWDRRPDDPVVVGLGPGPAGVLALMTAFAEADLRRRRLEIHTAVADPVFDGLLSRCRRAFADVDVDVRLTAADPISAASELVSASHHSDLLVVGAHHTDDRWSIDAGPVAVEVAHHAVCPVLLVGQLATVRAADGPSPADDLAPDQEGPSALSGTTPTTAGS